MASLNSMLLAVPPPLSGLLSANNVDSVLFTAVSLNSPLSSVPCKHHARNPLTAAALLCSPAIVVCRAALSVLPTFVFFSFLDTRSCTGGGSAVEAVLPPPFLD